MISSTLKVIPVFLTVAVVLLAIYWNFVSTSIENNNILNNNTSEKMAEATSIYDFKFIDIDGEEQSMEKYRGHVLIVVNVASKCGFTCVNYKQLTELHEKYGEKEGLRILAFPCNQFNNQEPLSEKEIKEFCAEYNVRYDMTSKINVNGDSTHPLWKFMKEKQPGILGTTLVKWNFTKFLIDKDGNVLKRYAPNTGPKAMEQDIIKALGI